MRVRLYIAFIIVVCAALWSSRQMSVLVKDKNQKTQAVCFAHARRLLHSVELYKNQTGSYPDTLGTLTKSDAAIRDIDLSLFRYRTNDVVLGVSNLLTISVSDPGKTNATIVGVLGGEVKSILNSELMK